MDDMLENESGLDLGDDELDEELGKVPGEDDDDFEDEDEM